MRRLLHWPCLLSMLSAAFGVAGALFLGLRMFYGGLASWEIVDVFVLGADAAFIGLSVFIWQARSWARRALTTLLLCLVVAFVVGGLLHDSLIEAPLYIVAAATLLFVVGVLCHPDVVANFSGNRRRSRHDRPST